MVVWSFSGKIALNSQSMLFFCLEKWSVPFHLVVLDDSLFKEIILDNLRMLLVEPVVLGQIVLCFFRREGLDICRNFGRLRQ